MRTEILRSDNLSDYHRNFSIKIALHELVKAKEYTAIAIALDAMSGQAWWMHSSTLKTILEVTKPDKENYLDEWNFLLKTFEKELAEREVIGGKAQALEGLL